MSTIKIYITDSVQVRLSEDGIAQHRKHFSNLAAIGKMPLKDIMPVLEPNPEDWVEFELWDLMQIFGREMYNGNPRSMFVENAILISKK